MNFFELKRKKDDVYPALLLDKIFKKYTRNKIRNILFYILVFFFVLVFLSFFSQYELINKYELAKIFLYNVFLFRSIFILFFTIWFFMYLLEIMYLSYYFKKTKVDFEVLKICNYNNPQDVTKSFFDCDLGKFSLIRMGIGINDMKDFLKNKSDFVSENEYEIIENDDDEVSFAEFGYSLIHFDSDFRKLLKQKGITPLDFKNVLNWVSRSNIRFNDSQRWWTKERLQKIPSIGKNWSYGKIYYLERFAHKIYFDSSYINLGNKSRLFKGIVQKMENILLKGNDSNILLISKETDFCMNSVSALGKEILNGTITSKLENKQIFVLDVNMLLSSFENATQLENVLQKILYQTANSGNVILVIPHLSDFAENSSVLGIDIKDLLSDVMSSTKVNIIATTSTRGFHSSLETDLDLMKNFEKMQIEDFNVDNIIEYIEEEVEYLESQKNLLFNYQSIKKIAESASRYFSEGSLTDKSIDILNEVSSFCVSKKRNFVTENDVAEVVEQKTGIHVGTLNNKEKEKLNRVESELKSKIIGQDYAIETIVTSLKRARIGIANPHKPLGTFLFIGPTGVGKTETCKVLSEVFFGLEHQILRIDMSEFSDHSSIKRLIGDLNNPGILSSKIKEKKYGVLLLDEFEKAESEVHDLFLQILDEGFFSDGVGERVDVRNFIIITTSNAGSDLIYHNTNLEVETLKKNLIEHLINERIFKPEFLNRFDDIILFNLLSDENLQNIVKTMIQKLNKVMEDKGLDVKINQDIINYLVQKGKNKSFGAREINRVIQREIESKIANAIISGEIEKGDTITFTYKNSELEINKII
jgi:ATP-dependent Clp protease ATP-binding subunit ClpA